MDRVLPAVVLRVVQPHVGERDVPDRQIEATVRQPRVGERLARARSRPDTAPARAAAVAGSSSTPVSSAPAGARPMNMPDAAPRLEHPPAVEPELADELPDRRDDRRVGVVRVDRRAPRRARTRPRRAAPAAARARLRPLVAVLVEHAGHRAPARPRRQRPLLLDRSRRAPAARARAGAAAPRGSPRPALAHRSARAARPPPARTLARRSSSSAHLGAHASSSRWRPLRSAASRPPASGSSGRGSGPAPAARSPPPASCAAFSRPTFSRYALPRAGPGQRSRPAAPRSRSPPAPPAA